MAKGRALRIRLQHVAKSFGTETPLRDISLTAEHGEFLTLLGRSGSGKSTLLRCIAGLEVPTAGEVYFDDRQATHVPVHRRNIGFVFQTWALFPHMSVRRNVAFGLAFRRLSRGETARRVDRALDLVRLDGLGDRAPDELSGGQQQRVALARAIVIEPDALLLDEPLSNLDAQLRKEMRLELKALHEKLGLTTVFVTHDHDEALQLSTRVALLNDGVIEQVDPPAILFNSPRSVFAARFLGVETLIEGTLRQVEETGGRAVVDTPLGSLVVTAGDVRVPPRAPLAVGIRAERVEAAEEALDLAETNRFPGRVETALYHGTTTTYLVRLGSAAVPVHLARPGLPEWQSGAAIWVRLPPEAMIPIPVTEEAPRRG